MGLTRITELSLLVSAMMYWLLWLDCLGNGQSGCSIFCVRLLLRGCRLWRRWFFAWWQWCSCRCLALLVGLLPWFAWLTVVRWGCVTCDSCVFRLSLGSGIQLHLLWVSAKMRTTYSWLLLAMLVWLGIMLMHGDTRLVQVVFLICRHCALLLLGLVGLIETCWADNLIELCWCWGSVPWALVGYAIGCCSCLAIPIGLLLWWRWWLYCWPCRC